MAKNNISLPASGGGLMRYSDEFKSKIQIKPTQVVILIVLVVVLEIVLYAMYSSAI